MKHSLLKEGRLSFSLSFLLTPFASCFYILAMLPLANAAQESLSFESAISLAQINDPWLDGNKHRQAAIEAKSIAVNNFSDPRVSVTLANIPTDGFAFDQEGMTQFKIGIAQMLPRGDSLALKQKQLKQESLAMPLVRQNRKAKVALTVGKLWLDIYNVQQSIKLIKENYSLFEQLTDIVEVSYSSGLGKTRQQDVVRAQLELTLLDDKLAQLMQQKSHYDGMLNQWLGRSIIETTVNKGNGENNFIQNVNLASYKLTEQLPNIKVDSSALVNNLFYQGDSQSPSSIQTSSDELFQLTNLLNQHPALMAFDQKIKSSQTGIELAKQSLKPQWGLNASYAARADDQMSNSRADFLSLAVSFDLPLFTDNKQDKEIASVIANTEAIKTDKLLLLREFIGAFSSSRGRLIRLNQRRELFENKLLPQSHIQAEASLTAYTNDDGDFAEVVRARIAVLNAELAELAINIEQQKVIQEINYLFVKGLLKKDLFKKTKIGMKRPTVEDK